MGSCASSSKQRSLWERKLSLSFYYRCSVGQWDLDSERAPPRLWIFFLSLFWAKEDASFGLLSFWKTQGQPKAKVSADLQVFCAWSSKTALQHDAYTTIYNFGKCPSFAKQKQHPYPQRAQVWSHWTKGLLKLIPMLQMFTYIPQVNFDMPVEYTGMCSRGPWWRSIISLLWTIKLRKFQFSKS